MLTLPAFLGRLSVQRQTENHDVGWSLRWVYLFKFISVRALKIELYTPLSLEDLVLTILVAVAADHWLVSCGFGFIADPLGTRRTAWTHQLRLISQEIFRIVSGRGHLGGGFPSPQ